MQPGLISLDRLGKIQSNSVCNILRPTLLIIIWVMLLSSCGDSSSSPSLTPQADSGPIKASTKTALAPNHREILAQKERLTKAQWTQYVESILGTQVRNWYGVVSNVTQQDNTYLVEVERGTGGSVEVYFELAQEEAINLNKDQKITFSGTISEIAGDQTSLSTSLFCEVYHCAIKLENVTWVLGYVPPAVAPTYDEIMTQRLKFSDADWQAYLEAIHLMRVNWQGTFTVEGSTGFMRPALDLEGNHNPDPEVGLLLSDSWFADYFDYFGEKVSVSGDIAAGSASPLWNSWSCNDDATGPTVLFILAVSLSR